MIDLIAISGKQLAGKDSLADLMLSCLGEQGFHKMPIARGIKEEFANIYGLTPQGIDENKALYRPGLIALGQRRRLNDANYWLSRVFEIPGPKIVSDLRLLHEYKFFKDKGAFLIRVNCNDSLRATRGTIIAANDPTECELDEISDWDAVLENDGSLESLKTKVEDLCQSILAANGPTIDT